MAFLTVENIVKQYASHRALDDVSFSVPEKSIFGLLGPNGAGKTSLIRIINQITGPDSGQITIRGERLKAKHIEDIGYLPEERGLYKKMKVGEQALYLAQLKGMKKSEAKEKLKDWFDRFEISEWWGKKVEELSKGMAQKVQFITTVLHEPKLLILDEPFSGFDPINTAFVRKEILRLRDEGATIILSTHNMGSVEEICDHITLLDHSKKILGGPVSQVRDQFREGIFEIEFTGNLIAFTNALWTGFEFLEKKELGKDHFMVEVRALGKNKINQLLGAVLPVAQIVSVQEKMPSMNDIFIAAVEQNSDHDGED